MALLQGSIVWLTVSDQAGRNPKCRPAVVVTPTAEIKVGDSIVVVAATSTFDKPLPANKVILPWHPNKHPVTGLRRECVAVCDWLVEVPQTAIQEIVGICPQYALATILAQLPNAT